MAAGDARGGWTALAEPPVEPRLGAALAADADRLLLAGGWRHESPDNLFPDDGALLNLETGEWQQISLPERRLSAVKAMAARGSFVVVAAVCVEGSDDPNCVPEADYFASFEPDSGAWRTLASAPVSAAGLEPLLWTGEEAIFVHEIPLQHRHTFWAYSLEANQWRELPASPLGHIDTVCATESAVVAFSHSFELRTGETLDVDPETPGGPAGEVVAVGEPRVAVFDSNEGSWSESSSPPEQMSARTDFDFACTSDAAVVLDDENAAVLEVTTREWRTAADAPGRLALYRSGSFYVDRRLFVWGADRQGLVLDTGSGQWGSFGAPPIDAAATRVPGGVVVYVHRSPEEWGRQPRSFRYVPSADPAADRFPADRTGA